MSKTGFSTLNRWLGRKNKEKTLANGKLSKSSNNLSISTNTINDTSQLEYNRITPLPVATTNAPFEQTFRITVLLPKDQLYVTRLGARTPLSKLLELVCENKSLDIEKYEFRNPADPSQIYDCEQTIGAVGLSEIRLCHKSESYDTFNADEIIKLHRTSIIRDSLSSSSDFSSRISKHTTKTTSPYSSTNSLNSMDSSGLNYIRTPVIPPPLAAMALRKNSTVSLTTTRMPTAAITTTTVGDKVVAPPPRKKRAAPRPPKTLTSQNVITEKTLIEEDFLQRQESKISDINGNNCNGIHKAQHAMKKESEETEIAEVEDEKIYESIDTNSNGYTNDTVLYAQVQKKNALNRAQMHNDGVTDTRQNNLNCNNDDNDVVDNINENCKKLPEPSPRKRIVQVKKKSAPAPPPRNSPSTYYNDNDNSSNSNSNSHINISEDTISLTSASVNVTAPSTPAATKKSIDRSSENVLESLYTKVQITTDSSSTSLDREMAKSQTSLSTLTSEKSFETAHTKQSDNENEMVKELEFKAKPQPIPRMTTTTLLNATDVEHDLKNLDVARENPSNMKTVLNISKVILNRTPTPEPCSLTSEPTEDNLTYESAAEADQELQQQRRLQQEDEEAQEESEEQEPNTTIEDDNVSKQADSGIGEPIPSPVPDSLPNSEISTAECKSSFESSSDDDDLIKVYNFKLGKTMVKPLLETESGPQPPEELSPTTKDANMENGSASEEIKSHNAAQFQVKNKDEIKQKTCIDTNAWTFSIPISPPPTFADGKFSHNVHESETIKTDTPITPKITERPLLDFENFEKDEPTSLCSKIDETEVPDENKFRGDIESLNKGKKNLKKDPKSHQELTLNLVNHQNKIEAQKENKFNGFDGPFRNSMREVENSGPLTSPTAPLNGLLEELSSIIHGKGVDSLVRSRHSDNGTIESAKPNTLENFSITNIKTENMPKWKGVREESKTTTVTTTSTTKILSNATITNGPAATSKISHTMEEEKLYRKRSNGQNIKQRRSIARADSFHSTVSNLTADDANLQGRSSSQLALNKLENGQSNGIARRSSSELSIGESPSLQSLEVIKTILRNHKNKSNSNQNVSNNSQNNEMDQEEILIVRARRPSQELKFASLELKPKSSLEKISITTHTSATNTTKTATTTISPKYDTDKPNADEEEVEGEEVNEAAKVLPKTYRYSGPPSINVCTWNERPKVQVSIKNEGDYIFGGKKLSSASASPFSITNYRNSLAAFTFQDSTAGKYQNGPIKTSTSTTTATGTVSATFTPRPLKPKPATFYHHRLSMPDQEFRSNTNTNITVKPLRDVVYENEPIKTSLSAQEQRPTVETVLRPQTQIIVNTSATATGATTGAPTNHCRIQPKRFSTPLNIINSNGNNNNNIIRSTSIKRNSQVYGVDEVKNNAAVPFGQNTLRRTGLKEKFLAKEIEQQQQQQLSQQHITKSSTANRQTAILLNGDDQENNCVEMPPATTASTTITMNLRKTFKEDIISNNNNNNNHNNHYNNNKQNINNTTSNNNYYNNNNKSSATICKPKPPTMLAFTKIQLKTVKADRTPTPSSEPEDTRDQLMAAIRNFNKMQLKKA